MTISEIYYFIFIADFFYRLNNFTNADLSPDFFHFVAAD